MNSTTFESGGEMAGEHVAESIAVLASLFLQLWGPESREPCFLGFRS